MADEVFRDPQYTIIDKSISDEPFMTMDTLKNYLKVLMRENEDEDAWDDKKFKKRFLRIDFNGDQRIDKQEFR